MPDSQTCGTDAMSPPQSCGTDTCVLCSPGYCCYVPLQSCGTVAMYALQLYGYHVCSAEVSSALHVDCLLGILLEDCFQSTVMQMPLHTCVSGRVLGIRS